MAGIRQLAQFAHAQGLQAVAPLQPRIVGEDLFQELEVLLQVAAEVVRMPPEVEKPVVESGVAHRVPDACQAQPVERRQARRPGAQEAAGREVEGAASQALVQLVGVVAGEVDVGVQQAQRPVQAAVVGILAGAIYPAGLVAPVAADAEPGEDGEIVGVPLVAREDQAAQVDAPASGQRDGGLQIRGELVGRLSRFLAVVVRKGVRGDFLVLAAADQFDQFGCEVIGRIEVRSALDVAVWRELGVAVSGERGGEVLVQLVAVPAEQEADRRPGRVDAVVAEEFQHRRDGLPHAVEVFPVLLDAAPVAHSPVEFEVEGNGENAMVGFHALLLCGGAGRREVPLRSQR